MRGWFSTLSVVQTRMSFSYDEELGRLTEHLPSLRHALKIRCVDDVRDSMTFVVILVPDVADVPLTAKVPELENTGRKRYLSNYERLLGYRPSLRYHLLTHCSGPQ